MRKGRPLGASCVSDLRTALAIHGDNDDDDDDGDGCDNGDDGGFFDDDYGKSCDISCLLLSSTFKSSQKKKQKDNGTDNNPYNRNEIDTNVKWLRIKKYNEEEKQSSQYKYNRHASCQMLRIGQ